MVCVFGSKVELKIWVWSNKFNFNPFFSILYILWPLLDGLGEQKCPKCTMKMEMLFTQDEESGAEPLVL